MAAEHVCEKRMVKRFLYYLVGGEQAFDIKATRRAGQAIASCVRVQVAFNNKKGPTSKFASQTAAERLGTAISRQNSLCPDNDRVREFFLPRDKVNGLKSRCQS